MGIENLHILTNPDSPMNRCKYTWWAPLLLPNGGKQLVEQTCSLENGHEGVHRSWSNVIAPNT